MANALGHSRRPACGCMWPNACLILLLLTHATATATDADADADVGVGVDVGVGIDVGAAAVASTTEIVQLPHALRHQKVSDFHRQQWQQHWKTHYAELATTAPNNAQQPSQWPQEHLRHSHNRKHAGTAWERFSFPPLRHHRHQQQLQQQQQQQQQQRHERYAFTTAPAIVDVVTSTAAATTAAPADVAAAAAGAVSTTNEQNKKLPTISFNASSIAAHRYFDRDGLFRAPSSWTTRGPKLRYTKARSYHNLLQRGFFADEAKAQQATGGHRISLSLNANEEENEEEDEAEDEVAATEDASYAGPAHERAFQQKMEIITERAPFDKANGNANGAAAIDSGSNEDNDNEDDETDDEDDDNDDNNENENDDYLYDDLAERNVGANEFPSVQSRRTAVKRFTNPFHDLHTKTKRNNDNDNAGNGDGYNAEDDANSDNEFSSEEWHRIQQEHRRKQQERQRKMQALRARHGDSYQNAEPAVTPAEAKPRSNDDNAADSLNSPYYIPGVLTRQKQKELGTLAAVQHSHRTHMLKHQHEKALASEHVKQILTEASCGVPQRRVERIQLDPAKIYMPHCTVLHRCTEDTGCCRSERQTCAPKHTESVDLYFFVKSMNEKRGTVERLTFINHTECHCVDRSKQRADEYVGNGFNGEFGYGGTQALRRATILNCNCPKLYEKILQEDGYCRCDCSSGNTGCDWLKRGMEHFSMIDRKCISEGRCKPPTCEHGNYMKRYGRCPRHDEQLSPMMLATNTLPTRH